MLIPVAQYLRSLQSCGGGGVNRADTDGEIFGAARIGAASAFLCLLPIVINHYHWCHPKDTNVFFVFCAGLHMLQRSMYG